MKRILIFSFIVTFILLSFFGKLYSKIPILPSFYTLDFFLLIGLFYVITTKTAYSKALGLIKSNFLLFILIPITIVYMFLAFLNGAPISIILFQGGFGVYILFFLTLFFCVLEIDIDRFVKIVVFVIIAKLIYLLTFKFSDVVSVFNAVSRVRLNDQSSIALMFLLLPILLVYGKKMNRIQRVSLISFFVLTAIIIFHRTMWVGLFFEYLLIKYLRREDVLNIVIKVLVFFVIAFAAISFLPYGKVITNMFADSAGIDEDRNTNARFLLSGKVIEDAFVNNNILGNGFGKEYKFTLYDLGLLDKEQKDAVYHGRHHNSVLSILYFFGWFPFFFFIAGIIFVFRRINKYRQRNLISKELIIFASAAFGMNFFILTNVALETPYYSFYYWLFYAGIFAALYKIDTGLKQSNPIINNPTVQNGNKSNF